MTSMASQRLTPAPAERDERVAAHHQELAVGEVDDPQHPEDHGQPDADQRQAGDRVQEMETDDEGEIHACPPPCRVSDVGRVHRVRVRARLQVALIVRIGRRHVRVPLEDPELAVPGPRRDGCA